MKTHGFWDQLLGSRQSWRCRQLTWPASKVKCHSVKLCSGFLCVFVYHKFKLFSVTSKIQGSFSSFSPQREWLQVALLCATSQHPGKIWWWYGDGDNYPLKIRHDVDNVDDDDDEEEAGGYGVITLNHGIVWMSSRLRILWSISLQNLVVVIINNHHCLQFFRRGELKKVLVIFVTLVEFLFTIYCFSQSRLDDSFFDNHHGQHHHRHRMVFVMGSEMSTIIIIHHQPSSLLQGSPENGFCGGLWDGNLGGELQGLPPVHNLRGESKSDQMSSAKNVVYHL